MMLWLLFVALAGLPEDRDAIRECLRAQDVACAEAVVQSSGMATSSNPEALALAADVALHRGDYEAAYDLQKAADAAGFDVPHRTALLERTLYATSGWVQRATDRFVVRYRPGTDAVLADGALQALERTDRFVTPLLGEVPPGPTIVEFYPDGRSFIAASSLTKDDVQSTGVVALSKWTRLLVTSPRALGRGYDWRTTLSHEYIHLVVSHATLDQAPVWLQEGIAKYLDNRWLNGRDDFKLSPHAAGLLSKALASRDLVPFEEMHPSLAKIKVIRADGSIDAAASANRAAQAYAQLSTLVAYAFHIGGEDVLLRALPLVREGVDPREALRQATGAGTFNELLAGWEQWVRTLNLQDADTRAMPLVLDGGTDEDLDPVFSKRRDLANFLRLGDMLAERGRPKAALVEYDKARDEEDPVSPLLAARRGRALLALNDTKAALDELNSSLEEYPEHAHTLKLLGEVHQARGDRAAAITAFEGASRINPFDYDVAAALLSLYEATGNPAAAQQAKVVGILQRGGEDPEPPPIHERTGTYELPLSPEATASRAARRKSSGDATMGERAPDFEARTLDGRDIRLSDYKGKVLVLDFWATWCGPCVAVMPKLSQMQQELGPQGLEVVGLSSELTSTVSRFVETRRRKGEPLDYTIALESGGVARAYGVSSYPTLFIIDAEGRVRDRHIGAGDMAGVERKVRELLASGGK